MSDFTTKMHHFDFDWGSPRTPSWWGGGWLTAPASRTAHPLTALRASTLRLYPTITILPRI